jgi:hypothetical protein
MLFVLQVVSYREAFTVVGPRGSKSVEAPVNNKFRLGRYIFFVLISYNNQKYKLTTREFRKVIVSVKSMNFIYVLWRPRGQRLCRSSLNLALVSYPITT